MLDDGQGRWRDALRPEGALERGQAELRVGDDVVRPRKGREVASKMACRVDGAIDDYPAMIPVRRERVLVNRVHVRVVMDEHDLGLDRREKGRKLLPSVRIPEHPIRNSSKRPFDRGAAIVDGEQPRVEILDHAFQHAREDTRVTGRSPRLADR